MKLYGLVDISAELGQAEDGDVVVAPVKNADIVAVALDGVRVAEAAALLFLVKAEDEKLVAALVILEDSARGVVEDIDEAFIGDVYIRKSGGVGRAVVGYRDLIAVFSRMLLPAGFIFFTASVEAFATSVTV